jgi:transposase
LGASERDEFLRCAWRAEVSERLAAKCFVFVDERGSNTSLSPLYGWSRVGERLRVKAPKNWGKNVTLLSSMSMEGMGPSVAVAGATTRAVFEAYDVEQALAPSLRPGQIVVVMDNLGAHKPKRVRELIEGRGCELVYLPAYSPDLNPIEGAFSKVKHVLRKIAVRTREALVEAMGVALATVSAEDARGFFAHCGYHASVQRL